MSVASIGAAIVGGVMANNAAKKNASAVREASGYLSTDMDIMTGRGAGGLQAGIGVPLYTQDYGFNDLINNSALDLTMAGLNGITGTPTKSAGQGVDSSTLQGLQTLLSQLGMPAPNQIATQDNFQLNPAYLRWERQQNEPEAEANMPAPPRYIAAPNSPIRTSREQRLLDSLAPISNISRTPGRLGNNSSTASTATTAVKPAPGIATTMAAAGGAGRIGTPGGETGGTTIGTMIGSPLPSKGAFDTTGRSTPPSFGARLDTTPITSVGGNNQVGIQLGDLDPTRVGLTNIAQQAVGRAGLAGQGLPQNVAMADLQTRLSSGFQDPTQGLQGNLLQAALQQGNLAGADLNRARNPFSLNNLVSTAAGTGAYGALQEASLGGNAARQRQLNLLRQEAAPEEARQLQAFRENLFATGRGATTGGAQLAESFAKGLGQADISRQLAAAGEGRAFQTQALNRAQGLSSTFGQQTNLSDNLLQNAFNRFQTTQSALGGLSNTNFQRALGTNELAYNRANQNLQTQIGLAGLPATLQAGQLANASSALGGQAGLQSQGMEMFQAALAQAQAEANARIGAGSNIAALTTGTNFGQQDQLLGNLALGIGERLAGSGGGSSFLANAFGGNTSGGGYTPSLGNTSIMTQQPSNPFNLNFGV